MIPAAGGPHFSHPSARAGRPFLRAENHQTEIAESYLRTGRLSIIASVVQPFDQLAFSAVLHSVPNTELIQCLTDIETLLQICPRVLPDAVILDVSFPGNASFQTGRELLKSRCTRSVAYYDVRFALHRARKALASGADTHYFTRGFDLRQLCTCIRTRANVENVFVSNVDNLKTYDEKGFLALTTKELCVLQWLADGHSVRSIAEKMNLAESTIDNHKSRMMKRLNISKTSTLVRLAVQAGLVDWDY
jgi:two-component system, NarL family, response regulator NreC